MSMPTASSPAMNRQPTRPIRVAVDLTSLRPKGENGGIKPFLFETLLWLGRQSFAPLQFLYLTSAATHDDVRGELARFNDELICVRDGGPLPRGDEHAPRERVLLPPPIDLLWQLDAHVLYCPFGAVDFALPGVCTISTVVDVLHRDFPWSLDEDQRAERERVFQEILAVADAVQCNSEYVVSRMREHYDLPPDRMFTVYNAVHRRFARLPAAGEVYRSNTPGFGGTPSAAPFFFYPANAWKHKNHEILLLAYGMYRVGALAAGIAPWSLVLTGHEDERWAAMRALAETLGVLGKEAVSFMGYVPSKTLGQLWETAGALVFPSLHEGFGIPLLEAMQHDAPVICSREGSLPEVGADACLFVDARSPEKLAEAMTHVATNAALRRRLVEAGRRRLEDFSLDHEGGKLLNAIVSLSQIAPSYRSYIRGIYPDGWTDPAAMIPVPAPPSRKPIRGTLTLRFNPMPAPRRLRLRAGAFVTLGSFDLPAGQTDAEIKIDLYVDGGPLWLEVPDAANLNPNDGRTHGIRLRTADLRLADGQEHSLFAAR